MHLAVGYGYTLSSTRVDLYMGATGAWTTAQLSGQSHSLAAATVSSVALFAGGTPGSALRLMIAPEVCDVFSYTSSQ